MVRVTLTPHARERAAEMSILTKRIKWMLRHSDYIRFQDVKYRGGRWHARGKDFTAVVVGEPPEDLVVVTVLFNQPFARPCDGNKGES